MSEKRQLGVPPGVSELPWSYFDTQAANARYIALACNGYPEALRLLEGMNKLVEAAQQLCTRAILPGSDTSELAPERFVSRMVDLMDGPFQRQHQLPARSFLSTAKAQAEDGGQP